MSLDPGINEMVLSALYTFSLFAWPLKLAGQVGTQPLTEHPVSVCVCSEGVAEGTQQALAKKGRKPNIPSQFPVFILTETRCALWGGFNTQDFL